MPSHLRETPLVNKTTGNDEFLKLMFASLRNQLHQSVDDAEWINKDLKHYINEKVNIDQSIFVDLCDV